MTERLYGIIIGGVAGILLLSRIGVEGFIDKILGLTFIIMFFFVFLKQMGLK